MRKAAFFAAWGKDKRKDEEKDHNCRDLYYCIVCGHRT